MALFELRRDTWHDLNNWGVIQIIIMISSNLPQSIQSPCRGLRSYHVNLIIGSYGVCSGVKSCLILCNYRGRQHSRHVPLLPRVALLAHHTRPCQPTFVTMRSLVDLSSTIIRGLVDLPKATTHGLVDPLSSITHGLIGPPNNTTCDLDDPLSTTLLAYCAWPCQPIEHHNYV